MSNYTQLEVWKLSKKLAVSAYELSSHLPATEKYGLIGQIQRAAVSIPSNIAEGAGRGSDASFLNFVRIAIGSLNELDTLVIIAGDVGLLSSERVRDFQVETRDLAVRLRNLAGTLSKSNGKPLSY